MVHDEKSKLIINTYFNLILQPEPPPVEESEKREAEEKPTDGMLIIDKEQGWRSGESTRLTPISLRFNSWTQHHVGQVCCWFSSLLREVFLWVLRFFPLLKNQHFQIPNRSGLFSSTLS